ncbi:AAA family ATPase [Pseudomonas helleri]|uniref:AAA family ATPase n=2 Tax=Pseudomonas TaxID=286 RepID=A0A7X2BU28_9PSED|nr:AAA family ATPase [Pseudomonas helleri]MQU54504.1 AAA family ATPase [Pseudomonas sp. FSL R10-1339]
MALRASGPHSSDTCALSLKLVFMLMLDLGGHRNFIQRHHFNDDEIAAELGLQELVDAEDFSPAMALRRLKRERLAFDLAFPAPDYPDRLQANVQALGQLIGLDAIEQRILGFCVLLHTDPCLNDASDQLGALGFNRTIRVLSTLLDTPQEDLLPYLVNEGRLVRAGLLEINARSCTMSTLSSRLVIESSDFLQQLRFSRGQPIELFKHAFRLSPPGHLNEKDYRHLGRSLEIATTYLKKALAEERSGVNILLYGPPGTGKTQLSRLLARLLGTSLYEIACTDSDGDPVSAHQRLCALRSAMSALQSQKALLLLDEIEDIFDTSPLPFSGKSKTQKGWINRMLEENSLPCFWLSNDIECLDNAYIRRFDVVIELPNPPKSQREQIVRECSGDRLGEALVEKLVEHEEMTPAVIARAARIARSLHPRAGKRLDATVECLVDATLKAQGFEQLGRNQAQQLPSFYSPSLINADIPLDGLIDGLRKHPEARLCFYGPPGTGKTAFGHWLAQELEKPLMVKRVSDLVSPYVGTTEQNLARAFEKAGEEQAVLLLDEVDSFLQDRKKATQSWEVTAVNEMLTQMENYRGLFIASTNLMRDLDEASLRRFDLKIHFGFLKPLQIQALFNAHLQTLKLKDLAKTSGLRLLGEASLTPGDFALVARRARFKPFTNAEELAQALLAESRLKTPVQRPIGFMH